MANFAATPEAVARVPRAVAFRYDALPLNVESGVLSVGVADPSDVSVVDALRAATRLRVRPLAMPRDAIRAHLHAAYADGASRSESARDDAPAVRAVDATFARAIAAHASDVHVEPAGGGGGRVRLRIDGILHELDTVPRALFPAFVSRIKLLAGMDVADRRTPQDGRYGVPFDGRDVDVRVASIPTVDGEKLVVRLLDRFATTPDLASLGMPSALLESYRAAVHAPWGFVVVTGPTGSGKTTTLYASLAAIDTGERNVCTVEDPVEMRIAGTAQVHVNPRAGVTFPLVLRAFMRQDPNVVMVGEMRDVETAAVAVSAALAGQLVFTSLHANDAPRTIDRLVELGVARHSLAAALTMVVSQRLVRTLCEQCRAQEAVPAVHRDAFAKRADSWWIARGCRACGQTGYLGRTGVYEAIEVDDAVRDAIASGRSSVQLAQHAARTGYRPMIDDGVAKVAAGRTSFAELVRVVGWTPR